MCCFPIFIIKIQLSLLPHIFIDSYLKKRNRMALPVPAAEPFTPRVVFALQLPKSRQTTATLQRHLLGRMFHTPHLAAEARSARQLPVQLT